MKKSIVVASISIITVSLLAFNPPKHETEIAGCSLVYNGTDLPMVFKIKAPDLYYGVHSRFEAITKAELANAESASAFINEDYIGRVTNYESIEVVIIENNQRTNKRLSNNFSDLSKEQKTMLRNLDYSHHFLVRINFEERDTETGEVMYARAEPHYTVVPDKQAVYEFGISALVDYIRESNEENTLQVEEDQLQAAMLYFTISRTGVLTNIYLDHTTGYQKIDEGLIKIINNLPGKWAPAENSEGEKIEQELVLTFGPRGGC